ncbi:hypothetical protein GCM10009786_00680 [Leucobacter alluvii]|uniref:DUF4391 domain-containing protein n=1 Tax=Leucobacter alluvii TaxID=340321 RepID=A0ABP5MSF3_9MICO
MSDVLYRWPEAAKFGRRIPKERFYEQGTVSASTRERFVSDVARITWAFKLAEATIHLPDSESVPEIQVLRIDAKDADISEHVLATIDKTIPSPIIFELVRNTSGDEQVRMVAAHKQPGSNSPKISQYFSTGWLAADVHRQPLPTAISLPALYAALLEPLIEIEVRPGEAMSEVADRLKEIGKLEREIAALRRKIKNEKQLNRKIELRKVLMTKESELEQQR